MKIVEIEYGLNELDAVAEQIYNLLPIYQVITFTGTLGAGKTTLVQCLLKRCGVKEQITSPTFTYVNLYENQSGQTFYHFDCYRIKTVQDFVAAGFDEYLYQPNSWAFIEWPEMILPLLDHAVCHVYIDYNGEKRRLTITC